jgi:hypothetical protein
VYRDLWLGAWLGFQRRLPCWIPKGMICMFHELRGGEERGFVVM